jgi:hypothetical protein
MCLHGLMLLSVLCCIDAVSVVLVTRMCIYMSIELFVAVADARATLMYANTSDVSCTFVCICSVRAHHNTVWDGIGEHTTTLHTIHMHTHTYRYGHL